MTAPPGTLFWRKHELPVGAVTQVFASDSARGYAVSIQDMLRAAGIALDKAA